MWLVEHGRKRVHILLLSCGSEKVDQLTADGLIVHKLVCINIVFSGVDTCGFRLCIRILVGTRLLILLVQPQKNLLNNLLHEDYLLIFLLTALLLVQING